MKSDVEIERDVKDELEWDPDLDATVAGPPSRRRE